MPLGRDVFAAVVSSLPVGLLVCELDPGGDPGAVRILYANAASAAVIDRGPAELEGRPLSEAFPAFGETDWARRPYEFGDLQLGNGRIIAPLGFPLEGDLVAIAIVDVTRERSTQARMVETLESMGDAFATVDHEWRLMYVNSRSEELAGKRRDELLGLNLWELFPAAVNAGFKAHYERAVRERVTVEFETFFAPLKVWLAARAFPTPDGLAIFLRDVTARHELEARLLQSQKLEAIGQLAGGVAHDFNNLLTVIEGYAALATSRLGPDQRSVQEPLHEIGSAARRAASLTGKLLAFSRKQMLQTAFVDLNDVVGSALALVAPLIGEHIEVHATRMERPGPVYVDAPQIEQAIVNIAVNARDAMPRGGHLHVTTEDIELGEDEIPDLAAGSYVRLGIRDDGCGMDEATLEHIFEPFFTTKAPGEGSGLGLATAYGTIRQSGGRIMVTSVPGEGTEFEIYLPRFDPALVPLQTELPAPIVEATPARGEERVLVVEDDDIVRQLVVEILESLGYRVAAADDPAAALSISSDTTFDLLITDVVMRGGDGESLARAVTEKQPQIPVLYMSGYTPAAISDLAIDGKRTKFLQKPFSAEELATCVRSLLQPTG